MGIRGLPIGWSIVCMLMIFFCIVMFGHLWFGRNSFSKINNLVDFIGGQKVNSRSSKSVPSLQFFLLVLLVVLLPAAALYC